MKNLGANLPHKIFWLTVGAVSGGTAGYLIAEVIVDRAVFGRSEHEVEEPSESTGDFSDEPVEFQMPVSTLDNVAYNNSQPIDKQPLSELVRPYASESQEVIRVVHKDEVDIMPETVHYYKEDNTFAFESGDLIDDPNQIFIANAHLHFGESDPEDAEVLYIKNDDMGVFYEIILMNASYKEEILGEPAEVEEKKPVKRSRRATKPKKEPTDIPTDELHESDGK